MGRKAKPGFEESNSEWEKIHEGKCIENTFINAMLLPLRQRKRKKTINILEDMGVIGINLDPYKLASPTWVVPFVSNLQFQKPLLK